MMLASVAAGVLAAILAQAPRWFQSTVLSEQVARGTMGPLWLLPAVLLLGALISLSLQSKLRRRQFETSFPEDYHGLADMLIHIHQSASPDSPLRWVVRAIISCFFMLFSGNVGNEGAAMEIVYAGFLKIRPRSARWFEQRRRTDAANSIAAGIAASFGAPFAAVLVPIELGIGGRTISSVICALSAFLASRFLMSILSLPKIELSGPLYAAQLSGAREWFALLLAAVACGFCGIATTWFATYFGQSLRHASKHSLLRRGLVGTALLAMVFIIYHPASRPSTALLEDLFWGRISLGESGVLFFSRALSFAFVLGAFGTSGVFWPVFALGGLFGFAFSEGILNYIFPAILPGLVIDLNSFAPIAALAGASAFWGSTLGAPVAGAVLAYELTDNLKILLPCLASGLLGREIAHRLGASTLFETDLKQRGVSLIEGRLKSILAVLQVKDAMVTDFECAREHEPVAEAQERLLRATHPFLPVIREDGTYAGLLTIDMVQDSLAIDLERTRAAASHSSLANLLEVKDLLYRSGFQTPQVREEDPLTVTNALFQEIPCVPVVSSEGRVRGLLFAQNVRLLYEREVAKRSLSNQRGEKSLHSGSPKR